MEHVAYYSNTPIDHTAMRSGAFLSPSPVLSPSPTREEELFVSQEEAGDAPESLPDAELGEVELEEVLSPTVGEQKATDEQSPISPGSWEVLRPCDDR